MRDYKNYETGLTDNQIKNIRNISNYYFEDDGIIKTFYQQYEYQKLKKKIAF